MFVVCGCTIRPFPVIRVVCKTCGEALEEFSELWFDQFDQLVMPVDSTRLLVALTSTLRNLPNKTPKRQIASKWKEEVDKLFMPRADGQQGLHGIDNKWHVTPDEILVMTQRLASVGAKDAVILAPRLASHVGTFLAMFVCVLNKTTGRVVEVESVLSALHRRQKEYAVYMRELEAVCRGACTGCMRFGLHGTLADRTSTQGHASKTVTHEETSFSSSLVFGQIEDEDESDQEGACLSCTQKAIRACVVPKLRLRPSFRSRRGLGWNRKAHADFSGVG